MATLLVNIRFVLVALLIAGTNLATSHAHEIRPAVVTLSIAPDGRYEAIVALNIEALLAGIGPQHRDTNDAPEAVTYNLLRKLDPQGLQAKFDEFSPRWLAGTRLDLNGERVPLEVVDHTIPAAGDIALARISRVRLSGSFPTSTKTLRWTYAAEFGSSVVRLQRPGQETLELGWLKDGQSSGSIDLQSGSAKSQWQKLLQYISVGFVHIVPQGLDHILFVVGLYLLGATWRPLLAQVTAFTVAHSITLALGLYGFLSVSPAIVEPLIALSIVYVAVENILTSKLHFWRPLVVFCFGLLHGLGFAGILQEIDLPRADFVVGLIGFNVGVELGQLTVILLAFAASGLWFRNKPWYRQRIVWPASALIALVGAFWTVERIWVG